eukprot:gnl/MRDRNA2_/MRDRNA2_98870_c0_seq1.p1 gnl/MRDRNA2_/MRDRNA2_98870_c0~~gnl/MRDRNA2_/MRDRNA2_98870_c0_seq1.p1  ORF type:complete len:232 (-),score=74.04 gnl/MRDRNA2_/MRDRNA2_98870_c0_seq1:148-843(-)
MAFALRRTLLRAGRHACHRPQVLGCFRAGGLPAQTKCFSSAAGSKVAKTIASELSHEEQNYEASKEIKNFLKSSSFKLEEAEGDVNMALVKEVDGKVVRIEWQLTSPFDPNMLPEGEGEDEAESTDFSVTIESQKTGAGMAFYCSTQSGADHRFVIGNVKCFANAEAKESVSAYNGPDFEDLDDKLQEALDEYLAEMGMSDEVCSLIDAMALDKEQREYMVWLKNLKQIFE